MNAPDQTHKPSTSSRRKSPATAGILNFLLPGAGYIYAGKKWGWALLIASLVLSIPFMSPGSGMMDSTPMVLVGLAIDFALGWHVEPAIG